MPLLSRREKGVAGRRAMDPLTYPPVPDCRNRVIPRSHMEVYWGFMS